MKKRIARTALGAAVALLALMIAPALTASAASGAPAGGGGGTYYCTGGNIPPGSYGSIIVTGICFMPKGTIRVGGDLTVAPGALLDATSPGDPPAKPIVPATVLIGGNVRVGYGAVLLFGCSPNISCPSGITYSRIRGNLLATGAQGVVVHSSSIGGSASLLGGGGGAAAKTCAAQSPSKPTVADLEPWSEDKNLDQTPVYSDFEDNTIGGNLTVAGLTSCWLGSLRNQVGGNGAWVGNTMGDPDALEIDNNLLGGNMTCLNNTPAVQFGDSGAAPNLVGGFGIGECGFHVVLPNPAPEAGQGTGVPEHIAVSIQSLQTYSGAHIHTSGKSQVVGVTTSGDTLVEAKNTVVLAGQGLTGKVSEQVLLTVHPNGSSSFEALDQCTCRFDGQSGSVTIRAYGTTSAGGATNGIFLVVSGGKGNGGLSTLAGWGTFSSSGEPSGVLGLVEYLRIT